MLIVVISVYNKEANRNLINLNLDVFQKSMGGDHHKHIDFTYIVLLFSKAFSKTCCKPVSPAFSLPLYDKQNLASVIFLSWPQYL